jgi:hypothetical protein
MTSDAQTLLSCDNPDDVIAKVRQKGAFFFSAIALAIAGAGLLLGARILTSLEEYVFTEAMRLRNVLGVAAPVGSPDWYAIAVLCVIPFLVMIVLAAAFQWQQRSVHRRTREMWGSSRELRRLARIEPIPEQCSPGTACRRCERQQQYLTQLLGSRRWEGSPVETSTDDPNTHTVPASRQITTLLFVGDSSCVTIKLHASFCAK